MATKADFTAEEWESLTEAPMKIAYAIMASGSPGPIQMAQEMWAVAQAAVEPTVNASPNALVNAVAADIKAISQDAEQRKAAKAGMQEDLQGIKELGALRAAGIAGASAVASLLAAKASPEEAEGFKQWLLGIAQKVAEAAKEGGFLGFGGTQVTDEEKATIAELAGVLGVSAPAAS
jgi:hypothetical protein